MLVSKGTCASPAPFACQHLFCATRYVMIASIFSVGKCCAERLLMNLKNDIPQLSVLIVEDDPAVLNLLTHFLEMGHYKVRSVSNGNQALQIVLQDCPDILITGLLTPGFGGLELCRRVRQLHSRKILPHYTYILVLTTQHSRDAIVEGLEAGADDFIEKETPCFSGLRVELQARLTAAQRIRRLEIDLEYAAKYDSLTGLLNRVAFFETAQVLWERSIRHKVPLAVVMMDCDLFKRVNDIHGHSAGDTILRELATVLRSFSRASDLICRYGGEEFCAILPGCNEETAWDWADRIRQQCESVPIKHADLDIAVTVSFGVAERTEATGLLDHLVDSADQALLAAKEWGRNRSIAYSEVLASVAGHADHFATRLFENVTAGDVMVPFPLSIQTHDSAALVADHFLKTRFDTLPVTDHEGKFVGIVSETALITLIGQLEQWVSPIKKLVFPNLISYPAETPIRKIVDFLNRTSIHRVMIVQDGVLVGYISRILLLRWLRNQWAMVSGKSNEIFPEGSSREVLIGNLRTTVEALKEELVLLDDVIEDNDNREGIISDRGRMVVVISRCQDIMDQLLKYGSIPTQNDSAVLT